MNFVIKLFKNKFFFIFCLFLIYSFVLSDSDLFFLIKKKKEINTINQQIEKTTLKLDSIKKNLNQLQSEEGIEKYAREEKFFKKTDEEIFVITYE